ncbi:phytoene desaturase family protein [Paenibacillus senegalimassiliensis]|uniref:phytoene desaturase family protein n=1 Tax=Paenibacillus senegalimassiliensis TaxID=1737426 RepID=UPI00073F33B9|nr:NAD(P)/FAD-dependent oxidoreductase [Paenibacillus senegalimassiliensis]
MARRPKKDRYDVIVIGAGMGGLGAATYLAQQGYSVLVAERHYYAGGYAHSFRRRQYTFDAAVRIVAGANEHGLLHDLLCKAGLGNKLPFVQLPDVFTAIYPEHRFTVSRGAQGLLETYSQLFPQQRAGLAALIQDMQQIYHATIELLHARDPFHVMSNQTIMKYRYMTFDELIRQHLTDEKAVYTFAALWSYYGAPPTLGSALYFAYAIMSYFNEEIYYLKGSFQELADAFVQRIQDCGGEVCLRNEVKRIVVEDKQVKGVELGTGEFVEAPIVVCNGDLKKMVHDLVGAEHFPSRYVKRLADMTVSMSAFEVFIGTDLPLENYGLAHETFIYNHYDYSQIYEKHRHLKQTGVGGLGGLAISCPTLADPGLAPAGKHTAILTTLVPYDVGADWKEEKPKYQEALIRMAEKAIPGLGEHLDFVESGTPLTMERFTNNSQGATYGWEQNMKQMTSRPQHGTAIGGLYLSGHWTDPGGGVVSALLSSYKLFRKIMDESGGGAEVSQLMAGAGERI